MKKTGLGNRLLSMALCLCMVLSLMPAIAPVEAAAAEALTVTIDTGASVTLKDTNGDSFYEIGTADELYAFGALVNSGNTGINVVLTADLTVNENVLNEDGTLNEAALSSFRPWVSIGESYETGYCGIFDGNGKAISGVYSTVGGVIGVVKDGGEVRDLSLTGSYVKAPWQKGALVVKQGYDYKLQQ